MRRGIRVQPSTSADPCSSFYVCRSMFILLRLQIRVHRSTSADPRSMRIRQLCACKRVLFLFLSDCHVSRQQLVINHARMWYVLSSVNNANVERAICSEPCECGTCYVQWTVRMRYGLSSVNHTYVAWAVFSEPCECCMGYLQRTMPMWYLLSSANYANVARFLQWSMRMWHALYSLNRAK